MYISHSVSLARRLLLKIKLAWIKRTYPTAEIWKRSDSEEWGIGIVVDETFLPHDDSAENIVMNLPLSDD